MKTGIDLAAARRAAAGVVDPEIPVLTIDDLGVLRSIEIDDGRIVATITPTYLGCPAMGAIETELIRALEPFGPAEVRVVHHPAWTTEWIKPVARVRLAGFGIAPPGEPPRCPRCDAGSPRLVSRFGSTACKALMVCSACGEPFDRFKDL